METEKNFNYSPNGSGLDPLWVNNEMKKYLIETAKWGKFLAIVGFIFIGLMVVGAFSFGSIINLMLGSMGSTGNFGSSPFASGNMGIMMGIYLLLLALLYFFPCFYLYQFATRTQNAILANLEVDLTFAFSRLKSFFKFLGILLIIILGFYALGMVGMFIGIAAH